jgi:hypothetical protein
LRRENAQTFPKEERAAIAKALEDFDGEKGIIRAMDREFYWSWLAMREGSQ